MAIDNEIIDMMMMELQDKCEKSERVLATDYLNVRAGRANPHILDKITVDYYGAPTPLNQVSNISASDARCLVISPWDASMLKVIEKQILAENIGLTPTNDGKIIRLVFPILTEERRKELVKDVKKMAEESKIAVRNIRRDVMEDFKKMKTNKEVSEDEFATYQENVEKKIAKTIEAIEKLATEKEKEVLSV